MDEKIDIGVIAFRIVVAQDRADLDASRDYNHKRKFFTDIGKVFLVILSVNNYAFDRVMSKLPF